MANDRITERRKIEMLERMLLIRLFEERVSELFQSGKLYGHVHMYIGQEAVAEGTCSNLRDDDYITSTHRGHGHCLAKGAQPRRMMAELFGRRTGYCKGKGGSMHIADFSKGILGANGIVAGGAPAAVGAALAITLRKGDGVVGCFFGDGALNQGVLHEAINFARIWTLPVIFVCENNRYAITTSVEYAAGALDIEAWGKAYGMPAESVDGMDVLAVALAVGGAVDRARGGGGPTLLKMETYRFHGHTEGEEHLGWGAYRAAEELAAWKARDPIETFQAKLITDGTLTAAEAAAVRSRVNGVIDEAVTYASESPEPAMEEALEDVFA